METINYDETLQLFFAEIISYLEKAKARVQPGDIKRLSDINYGLMVVSTVALNPQLYANYGARADAQLEKLVLPDAFIPENSHDNSVFLIYRKVVSSMGDLYSDNFYPRTMAQRKLRDALKEIKHKNSDVWLKKFVYSFKNAARFAAKTQSQYS